MKINKKIKLVFSIIAILLGPFLIIFGGTDDSPGAQLIGLLAFVLGIVGVIKSRKKNSK